ncbi:metallopeptidase family protein [Actinomadura madurae]|uniref:metallopeptidase family protein n=1 Tax=Actinomadura madurae TaxID=1993 RepID=UPI002026C52A|nr:metallopeptidase family protein [Actinomadura madurae]URM96088.1 metallopeptidase family protein [Actinomadura madurae]URN06790.1 metallopeptidase family protein [Actinomadura madurae]
MRSRVAGVRRRDRRGRGLRGPLTPPQAPVSRTRAERFADLVDDEVRRLGARWGRELARVEFTVEEVPTVEPWFGGPVPLGKTVVPPPHARDRAVRIVVFRRPVEARANGEAELTHLIRDLLVEEVADLLGLSPESVDPSYDGPDD